MATPTKSGGAWTDYEKYQFLLKVIAQVGGAGSINAVHPAWDKIELNGRTPKAMSEMWRKIKAMAATEMGGETPLSTPRKRKATSPIGRGSLPKKRNPVSGKRKKIFSDSSDDEEATYLGEPPFLGDSEEEFVDEDYPSEDSDDESNEEETKVKKEDKGNSHAISSDDEF